MTTGRINQVSIVRAGGRGVLLPPGRQGGLRSRRLGGDARAGAACADAPNVGKRDFSVSAPNKRICGGVDCATAAEGDAVSGHFFKWRSARPRCGQAFPVVSLWQSPRALQGRRVTRAGNPERLSEQLQCCARRVADCRSGVLRPRVAAACPTASRSCTGAARAAGSSIVLFSLLLREYQCKPPFAAQPESTGFVGPQTGA